ncbi:MAG: hypothetical protein ACI4IS_01560 [Acutalibacteraceae bacterium]
MEDMLKKIVEMDEKARELKIKAQQDKAASVEKVEKARKELYEGYLEKARERAKKNAEAEQQHADREWEETKKQYDKISSALEAEYAKNCDRWVNEIFENVIGD